MRGADGPERRCQFTLHRVARGLAGGGQHREDSPEHFYPPPCGEGRRAKHGGGGGGWGGGGGGGGVRNFARDLATTPTSNPSPQGGGEHRRVRGNHQFF